MSSLLTKLVCLAVLLSGGEVLAQLNTEADQNISYFKPDPCCSVFTTLDIGTDEISTVVKSHGDYNYVASYVEVNGTPRAIITKVDLAGEVVWRKRQTNPSMYLDMVLVDVGDLTSVYLVGRNQLQSGAADNAALFTKFNSDGELMFNQLHDRAGLNEVYNQIVYIENRQRFHLLRQHTPQCAGSDDACQRFCTIDEFDLMGNQEKSWRYELEIPSPSYEYPYVYMDPWITTLTKSYVINSTTSFAAEFSFSGTNYTYFGGVSSNYGTPSSRRGTYDFSGHKVRDFVGTPFGFLALLSDEDNLEPHIYTLDNFYSMGNQQNNLSLSNYRLSGRVRFVASNSSSKAVTVPVWDVGEDRPFMLLIYHYSGEYVYYAGRIAIPGATDGAIDFQSSLVDRYPGMETFFHVKSPRSSGDSRTRSLRFGYWTEGDLCKVDQRRYLSDNPQSLKKGPDVRLVPEKTDVPFVAAADAGRVFSDGPGLEDDCGNPDVPPVNDECCDGLLTATAGPPEVVVRLKNFLTNEKVTVSYVASYVMIKDRHYGVVTKYDASHNVLWRYRMTRESEFRDLDVLADGSVVLVGALYTSANGAYDQDAASVVVKISADGQTSTVKAYDQKDTYDEFIDVLVNWEGGADAIYVLGRRRVLNSVNRPVDAANVHKFSADLNTLSWRREFRYRKQNSDRLDVFTANAITRGPKGSVTLAGFVPSGQGVAVLAAAQINQTNGLSNGLAKNYTISSGFGFSFFDDIIYHKKGYIAVAGSTGAFLSNNLQSSCAASTKAITLNAELTISEAVDVCGASSFTRRMRMNQAGTTGSVTIPLKERASSPSGPTSTPYLTVLPSNLPAAGGPLSATRLSTVIGDISGIDFAGSNLVESRLVTVGGQNEEFLVGSVQIGNCASPSVRLTSVLKHTTSPGTLVTSTIALPNIKGPNLVSSNLSLEGCADPELIELCPGSYPIVTGPRFLVPQSMCSPTAKTVTVKNAMGSVVSEQQLPAGSPVIVNLTGPTTPPGRYFVCILTDGGEEQVIAVEVRVAR